MRRERGFARCGLACCLCSDESCPGCKEDGCKDKDWCENRRCSIERGLESCIDCPEGGCEKGLLGSMKPRAFREFIRRYGEDELFDCLERNEKAGVVYHRSGYNGDYDDFDDVETLINYIKTGKR